MPAVSKKQQKFFGIVRSVQKGEQSPTTPEVAKAASSMKKGDVKKFASTKHKGLPEKKKIEEDKQIKKIIKQLRKSVKSHDKQADTLEKKLKEENLTEAPPKVPLKDTGNPVQNWWNKFVPPPESSNNPNVRSGLRKPGNLEAGALKNLNKTAKNINKPFKIAGKLTKVGKFIAKNPGKTALIGAGVVGAGLLAKKALTRNKKKEVKEQTTFPQMQQRIRDAKERRREQQKKSEKLYMDTKKKGVKFYDKKGSGRLKDGKKVYD